VRATTRSRGVACAGSFAALIAYAATHIPAQPGVLGGLPAAAAGGGGGGEAIVRRRRGRTPDGPSRRELP